MTQRSYHRLQKKNITIYFLRIWSLFKYQFKQFFLLWNNFDDYDCNLSSLISTVFVFLCSTFLKISFFSFLNGKLKSVKITVEPNADNTTMDEEKKKTTNEWTNERKSAFQKDIVLFTTLTRLFR